MDKKIIISIVVIVVIALGFIMISNNKTNNENVMDDGKDKMVDQNVSGTSEQSVKEFSMDSFVEFVDGKPKPQFSVKEITVNKGDLVRLKISVTSGRHDFKIDEFNVYADTLSGQTTVVEFTADKVGEFVYYCNQPGHKALGHFGTLKVIE